MKTLTIKNDDYVFIENGDLYTGSYQVGPTFNGPTSDAGIRVKAIEGKSVQAVSHGYQLAPIPQHYESIGCTVSGSNITFSAIGSGSTDLVFELKPLKAGTVHMKCKNETQRQMVLEVKRSQNEDAAFLGESVLRTEGVGKTIDWQFNVTDPSYHYYAKLRVSDPTTNGAVMGGTISDLIFYQEGDGTYEPYTGGKPGPRPEYPIAIESVKITKLTGSEGEETLTNPIVLRSLPDGTKDEHKAGKFIRRLGEITFDGSSDEAWFKRNDQTGYAITVDDARNNHIVNQVLCNRGRFTPIGAATKGNTILGGSRNISYYMGGEPLDLNEWRAFLSQNPLTYVYPLETPVIEPLNLPILPSSAPSGSAQTDSLVDPVITWEALPAGSCALEVQELRKRIEELEKESVESA